MSVLTDEFEKQAVTRSRLRRMIAQESARVRRSAPEAAAYGATAALALPAVHKIHSLIEHKGRPPAPTSFYRAGRFKLPTKIPALVSSGLLLAGVVPYLQDFLKSRRRKKTLSSITKVGQHVSSIVFKLPHMRGDQIARIAEKSKAMATNKLKHTMRVAKLQAGEYRT